jgi:hypothetical protein
MQTNCGRIVGTCDALGYPILSDSTGSAASAMLLSLSIVLSYLFLFLFLFLLSLFLVLVLLSFISLCSHAIVPSCSPYSFPFFFSVFSFSPHSLYPSCSWPWYTIIPAPYVSQRGYLELFQISLA